MPANLPPRPLQPNELAGWRTFVETVDDLMAAFTADLAPHDITLGDYQVFVFLSEAAGHRMRMVDLAAALQLSPSGLTRRLDGLTQRGFVDRLPAVDDRRVMLAVLTDSGRAKLREAYPTHLASVRRRIFDQCSDADVDALGRMFAAIKAGLCDDANVTALPAGFRAFVTNLGVKDDSDDFVVIAASQPVAAAGVFTRSRFAAPSVIASRNNLADATAQAVVIVARNANVANGVDGDADNEAVLAAVAQCLGCAPDDVLIAATGVIGRRYPIERMLDGIAAVPRQLPDGEIGRAAAAITTTDTHPKIAEAVIAGSPARVVGMAKGAGMIEPNMATMIAVLLSDADVDRAVLGETLRDVVEHTFNCVSIDTDTSTSDTAVVLASGAAGPVDPAAFADALHDVALSLAKQIAADGEGAETLIEVRVDAARDHAQAKRVAKAIVNSPLVKTAVHGADPNWGRVAMAIGKCDGDEDDDIDAGSVVIRFGSQEVYPARLDDDRLGELSDYLRAPEVLIHVSLGTGDAACTVWGCDLTAGYVRINADYTT